MLSDNLWSLRNWFDEYKDTGCAIEPKVVKQFIDFLETATEDAVHLEKAAMLPGPQFPGLTLSTAELEGFDETNVVRFPDPKKAAPAPDGGAA